MQIEIDRLFDGKVTGITKFGVFVSLGDGKSGMVHISEISDTYVKEITDFVKVGDLVRVKVIGIDENGRVALSIKRALEHKKDKVNNKESQERPQSNLPPPEFISKEPKREVTFEDMMLKFKQVSNEKISDLKKVTEARRGGGFSRKNSTKF